MIAPACCERDQDGDGNCDRHLARLTPRTGKFAAPQSASPDVEADQAQALRAVIEASKSSIQLALFDVSRESNDWAFVCRTCDASCLRPNFTELGKAMAVHALEHAK